LRPLAVSGNLVGSMPILTDRHWLWLAAALYVAGFLLGTVSLLRNRRHSRLFMYVVIGAGFALQTTGLYVRGLRVHGCPIGNFFEILQFTGWSATAIYLVIGATFRVSLLGYFTAGLAMILTTVSLSISRWDLGRNAFGANSWIELHATLALFGYGVFGLLALTSAMYLLQNYSLQKRTNRGLFSFLPSMVDLDHISFRLLGMGVALTTASLAVGSVYWLRDTSTVDAVKLIITAGVWVAYAAALVLRWRSILIAKRLAWTCIALFAAALLSLGPVNSSRNPLPAVQTTHR
jgi:HemX protein